MVTPTRTEVYFDDNDLIVSKTNLKGYITYANDTFLKIAGYEEDEVVGKPHNLIRHPDMPRAIFKLLWETIQTGTELFAYVKNMTKSGDYYWVIAHVTPTFDANGGIIGYHSNRRVPNRETIVAKVQPLYDELLRLERSVPNDRDGLALSTSHLVKVLADAGSEYDEFVAALSRAA